jgi:hypothetical protein
LFVFGGTVSVPVPVVAKLLLLVKRDACPTVPRLVAPVSAMSVLRFMPATLAPGPEIAPRPALVAINERTSSVSGCGVLFWLRLVSDWFRNAGRPSRNEWDMGRTSRTVKNFDR